jgi:hypothetical protein
MSRLPNVTSGCLLGKKIRRVQALRRANCDVANEMTNDWKLMPAGARDIRHLKTGAGMANRAIPSLASPELTGMTGTDQISTD